MDNIDLTNTTLTFPELDLGTDMEVGPNIDCLACEGVCWKCHNVCDSCFQVCAKGHC